MSDDGEQERYDLGVLFVHGIGQQARGQTLTAWADPVIRWLQVWLRPEPEPGAGAVPDPVEVGAAELGPIPEDPAAPAQVELRVVAAGRADGQPAARRWLLAEAWWAEAFTLPRFRELAVWGFAVLPWTVVAHFAARLQRAWRGPGIAARVARVLWQALGLLLAVVLFPLLAVGVLVVVVLGAVPPGERKLASFVTVGSGQTKLVDLESLRDTGAAREVWLAPAGLVVMATSIWVLLGNLRRGGAPADDGSWMGPLWLALMGLGFLVFGIAAAWPRRQPDADELDVGAERGWLDLYASHDPVANGALFHLSSMPGGQLPLTSRPVVNFASPLRDHTGYWRNRDEFVATLAATLADAAGQSVDRLGSSDASWRRLAAARRRWRVGWLQGLRLLAVATAAVLLVVNAGRSEAIGRRAVDLATSRADLLPLVDWGSGASAPLPASRGAGLLAIALATLAGYLLLAGLWRWWDARESAWTLRRQVARHWTVEFVALLTGIGALLAMAWLLSAGVSLQPTTELIGLPVFLVIPIFFYALLMPGLRWLLLLLQRFGLARDVDRERSVVPALVPAGAAGLIVLLVDPTEIPLGVSLGLVAAMLSLPLLAATLPPLSASAAMRRLERRLRAWARAEPAPPPRPRRRRRRRAPPGPCWSPAGRRRVRAVVARAAVVAIGRSAVKVGLHYWNYSTPPDPAKIAGTLAEGASLAEQAGVSTFTVMDHFFQMEQAGVDEPMLEAYTTLGYVAARTERMTLGVLVTGVPYRHPGLLAKIVTTLDVLSGGRARLGIGASWYEREQVGLGVPVVPVAERFERLEETLQVCKQMWSDDNGPYDGRHYQLAETLCEPAPLSRPHPPILVGGGGERKTLRLVARYADACNVFGTGAQDVGRKLDVLRSHCEAEGRDYDRIAKTVLAVAPVLADVDGFVAAAGDYARIGVTEIAVMPDRHPVEFTEQLAERVLPRVAEIG